jgi:enoyl-[acyl-carrier protein] reductase III
MEGRRVNRRIVLVTGGTRGIGLAIAHAFAATGAQLVLTYLRNRSAAAETVSRLREAGQSVSAIQADSGHRKDNERVFDHIRKEYGALDVIIANGGAGVFGQTLAVSDQQWRWTIDTNAKALLMQAQLGTPLMVGRHGKIVSIVSAGAERAVENYGAIGVAKAAAIAAVRYLALELGPHGINVNAVSAGLVDTDAVKELPQRKLLMRVVRMRTPMRRITTAEDVAHAVLFLCSDAASMIQGHTLVVDGGLSIRW